MGFSEFCGHTAFWSLDDVWNTDNPDFSLCFQSTVLSWLPATFLLLCSPLEIFSWWQSAFPRIPPSLLSVAKLVLVSCLLLCCATELYLLHGSDETPDSEFLGVAVQAAAYLTSLLLLSGALRHGQVTSATLSIFWLGTVQIFTIFYSKVPGSVNGYLLDEYKM